MCEKAGWLAGLAGKLAGLAVSLDRLAGWLAERRVSGPSLLRGKHYSDMERRDSAGRSNFNAGRAGVKGWEVFEFKNI